MAILPIRKLAHAAVASTLFLSLSSGCHSTSASRSPSSPVEPAGQEVRQGPPSHAPAHGYRRKFTYVHDPSCNVYFDRERKLWFWIEGDGWKAGVELPSGIRVDAGEGVTVEIDSDTPFESGHTGKGSGKPKKH